MTNITIRLSENETERLKNIYGKHTPAVQRSAECWFILRQTTLREIKGLFTENELKLMIDNENGSLFNPETEYMTELLIINIKDGCEFDNLQKKWEVNLPELLNKIGKLTSAQCLFLQDWIEQFWNNSDGNYYKPSGSLEEYIKELI